MLTQLQDLKNPHWCSIGQSDKYRCYQHHPNPPNHILAYNQGYIDLDSYYKEIRCTSLKVVILNFHRKLHFMQPIRLLTQNDFMETVGFLASNQGRDTLNWILDSKALIPCRFNDKIFGYYFLVPAEHKTS